MLFQQVCLDIKESVDISYYTSFIYISIGYVINTLPLLEIYIKIINPNDYGENQLFIILDSLNIGRFLLQSVILHEIYIMLLCAFHLCFNILFALIMIVKKKNIQASIAYTNYGFLLRYITSPYLWIFNGIIWQIEISYLKQSSAQTYILIVDYASMLMQIGLSVILILFVYFDYYSKKNYLKINSPKTLILNTVAIFIYSSQELFLNDQNNDPYVSFPIVINMVLIFHYLAMHLDLPMFTNSTINYYYQICSIIQLAISLNILVRFFLTELRDQYCLLILITSIGICILSAKIKSALIASAIMKYPATKIIDMRTIMYLKQSNSDNFFLLRGVINLHNKLCGNINCYHRQKKIYKVSTKGVSMVYVNGESIYKNIKKVTSFFLKCTYEQKMRTNNDNSIKIDLIELLHKKLQLYSESLMHINTLQYDKIGIIEKIRVNNIRLLTNRYVIQINKQSYQSKLQFDLILKCESYIRDNALIMFNIFNLQLEFWKSQLNDKIVIQNQLKILDKIEQFISQFDRIAKQILNLHHNEKIPIKTKQWFNYYFYKLYIRNKKLKPHELEKLPDKVINFDTILKDEQLDEKSSDEEPNKYYQEQFLLSSNTSIIQVDSLGLIKNCNNNTPQILNYSKNFLLTNNYNILMPQIFKQHHQKFINHFQQTGQSVNMHKRRKAFLINSSGFLIIAYKYLKYIYNQQSNKIEYVAMFRQVQAKHHYLLLNEDWEIDSASQIISDLIGVKQISLFILAPKAMIYSKFKKYLTPQDKEFFNLNLPQSEIHQRNMFYTQNSLQLTRGSATSQTGNIINLVNQFDNRKNFQNFINQDDIINKGEDDQISNNKFFNFNLRIPKQNFELVTEFISALDQLYLTTTCDTQGSQLIVKDEEGRFRIVRSEFIRRCKQYQKLIRQQKFKLIKQFFKKYTQLEGCIDKILRVQGVLKNSKTSNQIGYIFVKIIRIEVIEENFMTSANSVTLNSQQQSIHSPRSRKSRLTIQTPRNMLMSEQYELLTNRESQGGFLLPDTQLDRDFDESDLQKNMDFSLSSTGLIKDDINKIRKKNATLIQYVLLARLLFFFQILITFLSHFLTSFFFNDLTQKQSVTIIDYLYEFQIVVAESYNSEIDLYLFNSNITRSVLINDKYMGFLTDEDFYIYNQKIIDACAYFNYIIFAEADFIKMIYENFESPTNQSGLDVQTNYQVSMYLLNYTDQTQIYGNNSISEFFRRNMVLNCFKKFPTFLGLQMDSINNQLNLGLKYQEFSKNNYIVFLILQSLLQSFSLMILLKYQTNIQSKYNTLFRVQASIPNYYKIAVIKKINVVVSQFCYMIYKEYGELDQQLQASRTLKNIRNIRIDLENSYVSQNKLLDSPESLKRTLIVELPYFYSIRKIKMLITINILMIGVICLFGTIILLQIDKNINLFTSNQFIVQSGNLWVLPGLKELMIQQQQTDYDLNNTNINILLSKYYQNIRQVNPIYYQSNINQISYFFDNSICDNDTLLNVSECASLLNGALLRGIRQYDYLLSDLALKILTPSDQRYQEVTFSQIYEFNKLYYFVMDHYLMSKDIWVSQFRGQLSQHDSTSLILVIFTFVGMVIYFLFFNEFGYILQKKREYDFIKRFYKAFLPNQALNEQKRLRVELIKAGFILK